MAKKETHIHKYIRVRLGKHIVYKCSLANCTHFLRRELVVGRLSICWRCGEPFVMNRESITLARPRCTTCKKTAKKADIAAITEFIEKVVGE